MRRDLRIDDQNRTCLLEENHLKGFLDELIRDGTIVLHLVGLPESHTKGNLRR